jgi:hypothetical protein
MTGLTFIVLVLGSYRVWMLIAKDAITMRLRTRLLGYDDTGKRNRWPHPHKQIAELVHCPWCLGFWISLVVSVAYYVWPHGAWWVMLPFAVSAGVALISVCFDRLVLDK